MNPGTNDGVGDRWFEDYPKGAVFELGSVAVDEDEVIAFARRYDPQPFHVDPHAAKDSFFGGLVASGWHTGSLMMRLLALRYLSPASSLGSPGIDDLRWLRPVRPGDVLSVRASVIDANRSRSRPDRGVVLTAIEVRNQDDEPVMTMRAVNLVRCRSLPHAA
jgi:acyl dehydratase